MSNVEYLSFANGDLLPIQPETTSDSPFDDAPTDVSRDSVQPRIVQKVEDSIDRIREFGAMALDRLIDLPRKPDKVTVEVAVKISAQAGVMIAKCATEANFKIAIEWSSPTSTSTASASDDAETPQPDGDKRDSTSAP